MLIHLKKKKISHKITGTGREKKNAKHHQTINVPELSGRTLATFAALYAWL